MSEYRIGGTPTTKLGVMAMATATKKTAATKTSATLASNLEGLAAVLAEDLKAMEPKVVTTTAKAKMEKPSVEELTAKALEAKGKMLFTHAQKMGGPKHNSKFWSRFIDLTEADFIKFAQEVKMENVNHLIKAFQEANKA